MCILVVKKAGVRKPTKKEINNCAKANPDGFGVAYIDKNGSLIVEHSFDVKTILKINKKYISQETPAIYHFRIATHGSICENNCHPFYDKDSGIAFAHNGILSIKNEGDMTDSETAFRRIFLPIIKTEGFGEALDKAVDALIDSSKFAFIDSNGNIKTYGDFIEQDSILWSNTSFINVYKPKNICDFNYLGKGYFYNRGTDFEEDLEDEEFDDLPQEIKEEIYWSAYDYALNGFTLSDIFDEIESYYSGISSPCDIRECARSGYNDYWQDNSYDERCHAV